MTFPCLQTPTLGVGSISWRVAVLLALGPPACADAEPASCLSFSDSEACQEAPFVPDVQGTLRLQSAIDALVELGAPGVIAYRRQGSSVTTLTSGVRDLETREPMRAGDRFRGASTSKSLLATVVLQLAGEGVLSLDDSVERWLPARLPRGADIRLRQLLDHTSGLAHNAHDPRLLAPYLAGDLEHYWSPAELVSFSAEQPLAFEPGHGYLYSNTNYHLLGLIIEAATGRDPLVEVSQRLLEPLALADSYWPARDPHILGPHAQGYHFTPDFGHHVDTTVFSPSWAWTAGGLITTVADLGRFNRALFTGELLAPELMAELLTTVPSDEGGYGLGVARWETPCGVGWGHEGDFPGYHSMAMTSLDGFRQAVVAITSDDAIGIGLATEPLARAVYAAFCPSAPR
jgi:D-alanyl-D-alanine carboxypeptidase